jgi:hypothetical protein
MQRQHSLLTLGRPPQPLARCHQVAGDEWR